MHLNSASLAGEMDERRAVIKKENAVECHMKGMQVLAMLAATRRVSTGVCQMVAGCAGGEGRIKATGRGIPTSLITEGRLCGGKPGKIRRW